MTVNCFHKMLHHSFLAGFWMSHVLSMQGFSIYLGSQCHKVLNIQEFWISQFSENASSSQQGSDYIIILNMSMFLICLRFLICYFYTGSWWICLNMSEYLWICHCNLLSTWMCGYSFQKKVYSLKEHEAVFLKR